MRDASFREFVLDQLADLTPLACRAMFGGHGLYWGDRFFGIIFRGRLYFRTDETTRAAFVERGMSPFRPRPRQTLHPYYEVPVEVIEDPEALVEWARRAARRDPARSRRSRSTRRRGTSAPK
ncbi:MAG TPA: TfoX/Sxy family protein [Candidatus Polarisedimenticolia bacterium]|nr:TfoX/Sxy family protein [Candidatus Polarisedimenticolia bacterium]